jgi:hypothetical protein
MAYNLMYPVNIFNGVSMATSQTSLVQASAGNTPSAVKTDRQDNIGIQLDWTGDPVGTFAINISSNRRQDDNGNVLYPGTFVTLPLVPAIVATGTPNTAYIDLNQMSCQFVQVVYTAVSGTGTLTGIVVAKAI